MNYTLSNRTYGFTIVELLIVIVVIAILASITVVSYNGIQTRAKTTSAASTALNVSKKAELANTLIGSYPASLANFDANSESRMSGSGMGLGTPTAANGTNTVSYERCTAGAASGGARIGAFNYTTGTGVIYSYVGPATGGAICSTWAATLTLTAGS